MEKMNPMSKVRSLFPEPDSAATAERIYKLKKTLILCEILQSSSSKKSRGKDEAVSLLSNFYGNSLVARPPEMRLMKIAIQ